MTAVAWRRLREGDSRSVVIGVDFGVGRTEAGFADLAPRLAGDYRLWETSFPPPDPSSDLSVETDPDRWVAAVRGHLTERGLHLAGIMAYCAGTALALKLAKASAADGRAPRVVLLDPETAGIPAIEERFHTSFQIWLEHAGPGILDPGAAERVRQSAARTAQLVREDPAHYVPLMEVICAEYKVACEAIGTTMGLDSDVTDGMSAKLRAFLAYLVVGARDAAGDRGHVATG
jgi:hypothetical protein